MILQLCLFFLIVFSQVSLANRPNPASRSVPGGIAVMNLPMHTTQEPRVYFQKHRCFLRNTGHGYWTAFIGIPLKTKPGHYHATWHLGRAQGQLQITVKPHHYPHETLFIQNRRKVDPDLREKKRIHREAKALQSALSAWRPTTPPRLIWPLKGRISSPFGLQRVYNGHVHSRHRGIDIAAPTGTAVRAAGKGRVVIASHYFYTGNTLLIDHGRGVFTVYCHLKKMTVTLGAAVHPGQIIGQVGSTGRATGPHLHWGLMMNQARVDPRLFLKKS